MPAISLHIPGGILSHGYSNEAQALQLKDLHMKIQAAPNDFFANTTIDADKDECPYSTSSIINDETCESLEFRDLIKMKNHCDIWICAFDGEICRLSQGTCDIPGTNKIRFIRISATPKSRTVTYGHICVNYRPQKLNPNRCRITIGGNHI